VAAWLNGSSTGLTAGIYITNPGCRTKRTNFRLDPHRIADLRTLRISAVSLVRQPHFEICSCLCWLKAAA
jgi:hypothetical protein